MEEGAAINNTSENKTEASHSNVNGRDEDLSGKKNSAPLKEKPPEPMQANNVLKKGANNSNANNSNNRPKKRRKFLRDAAAPKQPLTGYFRFLNDRRETVRNENPTMPFSEITRQLATEWNMLPMDQKKHYLDAAELDKERYTREFNVYKQTDAYRLFTEKQAAEKQNDLKKERNGTDSVANAINATINATSCPAASTADTNIAPTAAVNASITITADVGATTATATATAATTSATSILEYESHREQNDSGTIDIPIFTEEFLDHNKVCETELRQLRKATVDYESQNAVLQRHVDSLHAAIDRLEAETSYKQTTNQALRRHLETLQSHLVSCFSNLPLTDTHDGASLQNIDSYVERLDSLANGNIEPSLRLALRAAVSRLDIK